MIISKFTQGNLGAKKNRQKPISVASQEKKSQIATLATDSGIPEQVNNLSRCEILIANYDL
jgi:hypothetical protein